MKEIRTLSDNYVGCMIGSALGNAMGNCCRQEKKPAGFTSPLHFDGLVQLSVFTAEGLLRATHRAKMHGSNGTFTELIYESYLRWLKTQTVNYNDLIDLPSNDGWLIRRSEMYYKAIPLASTWKALKKNTPGEIGHMVNGFTDYEGMMRVAPVGLMFPGDEKIAFSVGAEVCALTHDHPDAYLCAGFYAALIARLVVGDSLPEAVEAVLAVTDAYPGADVVRTAVTDALYFIDETEHVASDALAGEIAVFANRIEKKESAPALLCYGLYCAMRFSDDYKKGVVQAGRYEKAPHAAGMFTGSVLGLLNGEKNIPEDWLRNLKHKDIIIQIAEDLLTGVKGDIFIVDREWVNKYPGW